MKLVTDEATADTLAARATALRADQADELAGRRNTRTAFRRWRERIPADLAPAGDLEILARRHAAGWLRRAEAFARAIDPGLAGQGFHVADYQTLGVTSPAGSGFTFPVGLFDVVRKRLPPAATPGHVVAVNLQAHAEAVIDAVDDATEDALAEAVGMSLCGTVAHELAHVAENDAAGRRLPADIDFEVFRAVVAKPSTNQAAHHGPNWLRAFAHATHRANLIEPEVFWWRLFRDDVRRQTTAGPGEINLALESELAEIKMPLTAILRRPPPAAFANLFKNPAARAA